MKTKTRIKAIVAWLILAVSLFWVHGAAMAAGPLLIAHRGASGDRPEHSIAAYELAMAQGADFIEPDLVLTKDGVLVARHENEISETTDVAAHPEFAGRQTTKRIDGESKTGWFTEDFTLAELKTLRVRERLPALRKANMRFNDQETIPTFDEIIALVKAYEAKTGKRIGLYPETKHPSHFEAAGLSHTPPLIAALDRAGLNRRDAPVFIQSFEVGNLIILSAKTRVKLIQLVSAAGGPPDLPGTLYATMLTPRGLKAIARYADGIGPEKALIIPRTAKGALGKPTSLVSAAHRAGLKVHPWTFRAENFFLPNPLRGSADPSEKGDIATEIRAFVDAGVDGLFSDNVAEARAALDGVAAAGKANRRH